MVPPFLVFRLQLQDMAARNLMIPFPPSSPSMALFKNGELVHMIERHHIEGRPAELIAENLIGAYEEFC